MMENRNAEMGHNEDDNDSDDNENDFTVYGEFVAEFFHLSRGANRTFIYRMPRPCRMGLRNGSQEPFVLGGNASHQG